MYIGYIYRHYIEIDNIEYSYIGQTTTKPEYRWNNGWGYINDKETTPKFGKAIVKYGWDNFEHETIIEVSCKNKEELKNVLDELEEKYIEEYDSYNNGFNSTTGGRKIKESKTNEANTCKRIICLTTGEIFSSLHEASKHYNISRANIKRSLKNKNQSAGKHPITGEKLIWDYYNEDYTCESKIETYKYICYNDNEKYMSYKEMSEIYGFSISQLYKCCNGKQECLYTPEGEKIFFGKL